TSFQVPSGSIRDLSLNGNVLLMSAATGGLLAYDAADPASLTSSSRPIGVARGTSAEFWAVASDQHGRVYATGTDGVFGFLQSYRLDDFLGSEASPKTAQPRAASFVSWVPGYSSGSDLSSEVVLSDRPEGLPRRLQIAVQDTDLRYDNLTSFTAALASFNAIASTSDAGTFKKLRVTIPRENGFPYRTQRITIENLTRDMRWSGDATDVAPAVIDNVIARTDDQLRLVLNERTYGVVTIFGYGAGVFDLNAMESNDMPERPASYAPIVERVRLTRAALDDCGAVSNPAAIQDLTFSPEIALLAPRVEGVLPIYGTDVHKGVLDVNVKLDDRQLNGAQVCDDRNPLGLILTSSINPRMLELDQTFTTRWKGQRHPFVRFNGVQPYHWRLEGPDNKAVAPVSKTNPNPAGQRGSQAGKTVERDYLLVPSYEYGLAVIDATFPPNSRLDQDHLASVIWIPAGAVAVRVIPRSHYATVVDAEGRLLLVDLSNIDERWSSDGTVFDRSKLFPIAARALMGDGTYGTGAPDPRIIWSSQPGLVAGALAPVI